MHRFTDVVRDGDVLVLLDEHGLHRAVVDGPPVEMILAERAHVTRRVRWRGIVPRDALLRPYRLQDPQLLFALRGEAAVGD
jgi:hypothetical protein